MSSTGCSDLSTPVRDLQRIPPDIRRNTWLLFLAQAFLSTGLTIAAQLGSLIVFNLSGAATLAGVPTAITSLTVATIGYPAGRFMDRRGRRPGLVLGFLVGAFGAALVAASVEGQVLAGYFFGVVIFAVGVTLGQLTRAAVGDMYPTERRAGAVGLVVTGGLIGGVSGPALVALGARMAHHLGASPLAVPWVFVLAAFGTAGVLLFSLRPDPREIAQRLSEYFPEAGHGGEGSALQPWSGGQVDSMSVSAIVSTRPAQAAMIAMACAQATMNMMMATSSLMMSLNGHSMATISLALAAHILGMFALSVPVGRLADRIGRLPVLVGGALLTASSGLMFTLGVHSALVASMAFYLVGLGWCLSYVSGAALLGDLSGPITRARVLSLTDVVSYIMAMAASLLSGVLLARGGELTVGVVAMILGSVPLLAILRAGRAMAPGAAASLPTVVPVDGGK